MAFGKVIIHYQGTNKGPIYLRDVGQRNQLGGGKGIYSHGQDQYVDYGTDATLIATADVMLSCSANADGTGVIKSHVISGTWTAEFQADATGTI
jgi:hypothetical protein